ncbi:MAG: prephenate dehydrogenase/arogenate dehydrogenase family protein, partial [Bacteroidota bacterium]
MNIVIVGIGLIGGSFAKELRLLRPDSRIYGIDRNPDHLEEALALRIIDIKADYGALAHADLVVVCVPVDALVRELPQILDAVPDGCLVIDGGSTKELICRAVGNHPNRRNFLACHPIAGTEFSGPSAAQEGLYRGKTNIICEVEKTAFK